LSILLAKFSLAAATVALIVAPAVTAAPAADKPVKKIDDGLLDKIELYVATLPSPADQTVIVRPFTSGKAELGTGNKDGDKTEQDESKQMQTEGPKFLGDALIAKLQEEGGFKGGSYVTGDAPAAADANTLIVEGEFTELDPGSRAKRYFVGFGAGKSVVAVKGTIKDGSGKLLANFTQRRVGTMGVGGGDSIKKMTGDCKNIGEDIAKFLSAWAKGKKLD
jgi:hypothetical protein